MRESLRERVGWRLRRWADRIDPANTPRYTGWSFTIEPHEGIRFRDDKHGCPVAYLSRRDYERAHTEADKPAPRLSAQTLSGLAALWQAAEDHRLASLRSEVKLPDDAHCTPTDPADTTE